MISIMISTISIHTIYQCNIFAYEELRVYPVFLQMDPVFQNEAGRLAKAKASRRGPMRADPHEIIIYGNNWNMIYIYGIFQLLP